MPLAAALFAFIEIAFRLGTFEVHQQIKTKIRDVIPRWADIRAAFLPTVRGTTLGAALGIPAGAVFAMLMGSLQIQGIQPGPGIMTEHADLFWGLIASMWLGNRMLLVLNLPLIGVWIKLLETPYRFIYPTILLLSCIGCYAVSNQVFDIRIAAAALLAGYVLEKLDCSPGPLIIAMILGPILEENLRRSMLISRGDPTVFLKLPISAAFLLLTAAPVAAYVVPAFRRNAAAKPPGAEAGATSGDID